MRARRARVALPLLARDSRFALASASVPLKYAKITPVLQARSLVSLRVSDKDEMPLKLSSIFQGALEEVTAKIISVVGLDFRRSSRVRSDCCD